MNPGNGGYKQCPLATVFIAGSWFPGVVKPSNGSTSRGVLEIVARRARFFPRWAVRDFDGHYLYDRSHRSLSLRVLREPARGPLVVQRGSVCAPSPLPLHARTIPSLLCNFASVPNTDRCPLPLHAPTRFLRYIVASLTFTTDRFVRFVELSPRDIGVPGASMRREGSSERHGPPRMRHFVFQKHLSENTCSSVSISRVLNHGSRNDSSLVPPNSKGALEFYCERSCRFSMVNIPSTDPCVS